MGNDWRLGVRSNLRNRLWMISLVFVGEARVKAAYPYDLGKLSRLAPKVASCMSGSFTVLRALASVTPVIHFKCCLLT
jgi:hypothetical protein